MRVKLIFPARKEDEIPKRSDIPGKFVCQDGDIEQE
jgi:hypothetical protein